MPTPHLFSATEDFKQNVYSKSRISFVIQKRKIPLALLAGAGNIQFPSFFFKGEEYIYGIFGDAQFYAESISVLVDLDQFCFHWRSSFGAYPSGHR